MKTTIKTLLALMTLAISPLAQAKSAHPPGVSEQPDAYFYTGKPYDADLRNYVFIFRNYNPEINRWTSTDPSGFLDGSNSHVYITNDVLSALDPDGLAKVKVEEYTDIHEADCLGWPNQRGDGTDWTQWYTGNGSAFFKHLGALQSNPTVANLANTFVFQMLGLVGAGAQAQKWTAYAGDISWTIFKDVQQTRTKWYFNYTTANMMQSEASAATGWKDGKAFVPTKAAGELIATVPNE